MNWTRLSSIAEILSSVAVLVTLVFLTVEMQQNTAAVRAGSLDATLSVDLQHLYSIVDEPELWFMYYKEDLSDSEKIRLFHFLAAFTRMAERNWRQYQTGALDPTDWETYQGGLLGTLSAPQPLKWWQGVNGRDLKVFNPEFVDYLNAELAAMPENTPARTLNVFD